MERATADRRTPHPHPLLRSFVDQVLTAVLAMVPGAFVIPLGKTVATVLRREVERGSLQAERCLFEFPHPSGANGHRARLSGEHRETMAAQVAEWTL